MGIWHRQYASCDTWGNLVVGNGQGNGAGLAIWLAMSIPLIEMLWCHGYVSSFCCPLSHCSISLIGLIYVDNCDLFIFSPSANDAQHVITVLQQNICLWQGGVHAMGGSLALKNAHGVYSLINITAHDGSCTLPHWFPMTSLLQALLALPQPSSPFSFQGSGSGRGHPNADRQC